MIVQFLTVRWLKRSFHNLPASKLAPEYSKKANFVKVFMIPRAVGIIREKYELNPGPCQGRQYLFGGFPDAGFHL